MRAMEHMEVGARQMVALGERRKDYTAYFGPRKGGGLCNVMHKVIAFGGRDLEEET